MALDGLDQLLAFGQVKAGLMLGPQLLDLWLTDKGGRAIAHGVDANIGPGSAWPRVDVLHNSAVAGVSLAALVHLGAEGRALQHLQLAADADGAQVGENALAHVKVGHKGHVPLEVKAVGKAGLRQELLGLSPGRTPVLTGPCHRRAGRHGFPG